MKIQPEPFAVDLSSDGIFLWHRKPGKKWEFLGSVPLNSGNLRQQLETLKTTAEGIEAPSQDAIVRIPTAEVQTLTVAYDLDTDSSWETRIISAIEAASGVSIRTLAFDIDRGDGTSDMSVAWTPMAVIEQAETFVNLIGFHPTRYTTDVDVTDFPRNPNFQIADYHDAPEDISGDTEAPNATDATKSPALQTTNPAPTLDPLTDYPKVMEKVSNFFAPASLHDSRTKYPKGDFRFLWFSAIILILVILIAAYFYY